MTNREMDAFIAEKCFGWIRKRLSLAIAGLKQKDGTYSNATYTVEGITNGTAVHVFEGQHPYNLPEMPRYTESMTDAWPVFEWLLENHPWGDSDLVLTKRGSPFLVAVKKDLKWVWSLTHASKADTFPLAICKAAVAAVEEIERAKNARAE